MALSVILNGQLREFTHLETGASLAQVVAALELKGDRIAIEHNGDIAQRTSWTNDLVKTGDRLEIVHFVGGGAAWRKKCFRK
ncbi:MAG TPA: sulfur carrier protein ThiS [Acidobacteriaceae bacterium]|jgi:sulfur carrier protein|nr:sulfur carrier protein ThiS [Acidobacteriaceae bacterium]